MEESIVGVIEGDARSLEYSSYGHHRGTVFPKKGAVGSYFLRVLAYMKFAVVHTGSLI